MQEKFKKKWSGRPDSNWQPLAPKASALPIAPRPDLFQERYPVIYLDLCQLASTYVKKKLG